MACTNAIQVVKRAFSVLGAEEQPRGSNILKGPLLEICQTAGYFPGPKSFWCLWYALGCVRMELSAAGIAIPDYLQKEGSTGAFLERADEAHAMIRQPAFGAIAIFLDSKGRPFHAGLCITESEVFDGHAWHIEGNTDLDGSPNGYTVAVRHRPIASTRWVKY